jgi:2'-5' RNA ligase
MAFIGIAVPNATARLFGDIEVPGTREPSASLHVTLVYIGSGVAIDVIAEAVKATYAVTAKTRPFTVGTTRVTSFPINPDDQGGHPIIARVESDDLHDLRQNLVDALTDAGVDFNNKFPDYKPHVTLAYAPEAVEEFRIPTIEWGAHEIVMWGGDEGDGRLTVTFPLALKARDSVTAAAMPRRVAERFMSGAGARDSSTSLG